MMNGANGMMKEDRTDGPGNANEDNGWSRAGKLKGPGTKVFQFAWFLGHGEGTLTLIEHRNKDAENQDTKFDLA
jgi:hypothetical protein